MASVQTTFGKTKQHPYKITGPKTYKKLIFSNAEAAMQTFDSLEFHFETSLTSSGNQLFILRSKKYPDVKQISVRVLNHLIELKDVQEDKYLSLVSSNIDASEWIMSEATNLCDFSNKVSELLNEHVKHLPGFEGKQIGSTQRNDIDNFKVKIPSLSHKSDNAFNVHKVDAFNQQSGVLLLNIPYGCCMNTSEGENEEWICFITFQLNLFKDKITTVASNNKNIKKLNPTNHDLKRKEPEEGKAQPGKKLKINQPFEGAEVERAGGEWLPQAVNGVLKLLNETSKNGCLTYLNDEAEKQVEPSDVEF